MIKKRVRNTRTARRERLERKFPLDPAAMGISVRTVPPKPLGKGQKINIYERERPWFPLELTIPKPIVLPEITKNGSGRKPELNSNIANKILAVARTGAHMNICAAAGGVSERTLYDWLRRDDHPAYERFQKYFREAETYAELIAIKAIYDAMPYDWKAAEAFLARRFGDRWGKVIGQDGGGGSGTTNVLNNPNFNLLTALGVKTDIGSLLEEAMRTMQNKGVPSSIALTPGKDGVHRPKDPRPPKQS